MIPRKMPPSFHSNDLHIRFYRLSHDHNNQLKAESQVLESLHESCLIQDISVKIAGVPEQMSGAGEVHCPHEVLPSLAGCGGRGWGFRPGRTLQAATPCCVMMWSRPEAGGLGSVRFMVGLSEPRIPSLRHLWVYITLGPSRDESGDRAGSNPWGKLNWSPRTTRVQAPALSNSLTMAHFTAAVLSKFLADHTCDLE